METVDRPVVALLTDFGTADGYVAQMTGRVLGICPEATVVDVTHEVPPQDVLRAAYLLEDVVESFPKGTVFVVVVDPGVGSARAMVAAEIGDWRFVAPDNGVLSVVAERFGAGAIHALTAAEYRSGRVSNTFHGRDVMGPAGAHWAKGTPAARFGPARDALEVRLSVPPVESGAGFVRGAVLWADHFGNLVTNVRAEQLPPGDRGVRVAVGETSVAGIQACYADVAEGELLALVGSSGRLEVSVRGGSAAARLGWQRGDERAVRVEFTSEGH